MRLTLVLKLKLLFLGHHVFEKGILEAREGNYALRLYIPHPPAIITCVSLHSQEYCTPSGICAGHFTPKRYTCLPFHVLAISRACHCTCFPCCICACHSTSMLYMCLPQHPHAVYVLATAPPCITLTPMSYMYVLATAPPCCDCACHNTPQHSHAACVLATAPPWCVCTCHSTPMLYMNLHG